MWHTRTREAGFTLIELMISVTIAVLVLMAATSLGISTWRTFGANEIRENVHRSARFVALSLERDFQGTGVGMESTPSFGTLAVWGDTIIILRVPFEPNETSAYVIDPPAGTANPLPSGGTCGPRCIDFKKDNGAWDLKAGDLARLQVNDKRHLILIESVTPSTQRRRSTSRRITPSCAILPA